MRVPQETEIRKIYNVLKTKQVELTACKQCDDIMENDNMKDINIKDINIQEGEIGDERRALLRVTALSTQYCALIENAMQMEKRDFVASMLGILPRIYSEFLDLQPAAALEEDHWFAEYVDEDYYENIRRHVEHLLGPDDVFLETFEEDMKYSDTPIAASISECLADIFQPLYNFVSVVRETDGDRLVEAYSECRDNFASYWAQTLCNVMRALNSVYFNSGFDNSGNDEESGENGSDEEHI